MSQTLAQSKQQSLPKTLTTDMPEIDAYLGRFISNGPKPDAEQTDTSLVTDAETLFRELVNSHAKSGKLYYPK